MPNTHESRAALLPLLFWKDIRNITQVFVIYNGDIVTDDKVTQPENSIIAVIFLCILVNYVLK